jgi:hypothetical protein
VKYFILFMLLLIPLVSAISLDSTTILNTTVSNSSITFSENITVDRITITKNQIDLENISCSFTGNYMTELMFNVENSNNDSSDFCMTILPISSIPEGGISHKISEKLEKYSIWNEISNFFDSIFNRDDCELFGINFGNLFGLCWYFWVFVMIIFMLVIIIIKKFRDIIYRLFVRK